MCNVLLNSVLVRVGQQMQRQWSPPPSFLTPQTHTLTWCRGAATLKGLKAAAPTLDIGGTIPATHTAHSSSISSSSKVACHTQYQAQLLQRLITNGVTPSDCPDAKEKGCHPSCSGFCQRCKTFGKKQRCNAATEHELTTHARTCLTSC